MVFSARSDVGCVKLVNQDCFGQYKSVSSDMHFFVLADGMGGYKGGEVASAITVSVCMKQAKNYSGGTDKDSLTSFLKETVNMANEAIYSKAGSDFNLYGMGTTVVLCVVTPTFLIVANVGDSRAYISNEYMKERLTQLTVDHSEVELLIQEGRIQRFSPVYRKWRHILTKALGMEEYVEPDIFVYDYWDKDILILCSDGLHSMVEDSDIAEIIFENKEADKVCSSLVERAKANGGDDNITVIAVSLNK